MLKSIPPSFLKFFIFTTAGIGGILWFFDAEYKPVEVDPAKRTELNDIRNLMDVDRIDARERDVTMEDVSGYSSEVGRVPEWRCDTERALVEFVLVDKVGDQYQPSKGVSALDTRKASDESSDRKLKESDCPYWNGTGSGNEPYIYYLNIAKHCKNCNGSALLPGEKYKLVQVGKHENLNYTFKIPPADELEFQHGFDREEMNGTEDDPVYRVFVDVDEALKTREEPKTPAELTKSETERILMVSGVPELADGEQLLVHYLMDNGRRTEAVQVDEGTWAVSLKKRNLPSTTGGTLVLYRVTPSKRKRTGIVAQLIGYLPEVRNTTIALSGSRYRRYDRKAWHRQRIKLNPYLSDRRLKRWNELSPEEVEETKGVFLTVDQRKTEKLVHVSVSKPEVAGKTYYVTLTAPAGVYELMVEETVVRSSFRWPPDEK